MQLFFIPILIRGSLLFKQVRYNAINGYYKQRLLDSRVGPSPGAATIEYVDPGHRVRIISKEGIWYQISWKDKQAYIRDVYLLPIGN